MYTLLQTNMEAQKGPKKDDCPWNGIPCLYGLDSAALSPDLVSGYLVAQPAVPKKWGSLFGGTYNKDYIRLGSTLAFPMDRNHHRVGSRS